MSTFANPFQAGTYDGRPTFHTDAESRVRAAREFNRAQCEAGLLCKGLQKTVVVALQRRLRKLAKVATTIRFEDHGQDFLEWDLDAVGKVIECRPLQGWAWCKRTVVNHAELRNGSKAVLDNGDDIRYPLVRVQRFKGD